MQKSSDKRTVMAFGTFDYFHAGHENYLQQAKALGDELIVVVARDETVQKVKSKTPMFSERKRVRDAGNCPFVDRAVLGYADDKYRIIKKYKPDVLALGYDQFVFTYGLRQFFIKEGLNIEIVRLHPYEPGTFKSSIIRKNTEANATPCENPALETTLQD